MAATHPDLELAQPAPTIQQTTAATWVTIGAAAEPLGWLRLQLPPDRATLHDEQRLFLIAAVGEIGAALERLSLQRQLETQRAQLVQMDKLAAMGQLAASVAHEINNPIAVMLGFAQTMLDQLPATDMSHLAFEQIEREAMRCRRIVQNLLAFARRKSPDMQPINLSETAQGALALLQHQTYISNIQTEQGWTTEPLFVLGDPNQLEQVFLNLLLNAVQAMPNGGTLTVSTERAGDHAQVRIADTGEGISPHDLPHIFDAFYTAKGDAQGTGLGLSVSHDIITGHQGTIAVESLPGQGSTFIVSLPLPQP